MKLTIEFSDQDLKNIIKSALEEYYIEKNKNEIVLYTINQVAKKFGKAHKTIKNMIESGIIKATKDKQITSTAINEYLNNQYGKNI